MVTGVVASLRTVEIGFPADSGFGITCAVTAAVPRHKDSKKTFAQEGPMVDSVLNHYIFFFCKDELALEILGPANPPFPERSNFGSHGKTD
jgi:hypothetical protein